MKKYILSTIICLAVGLSLLLISTEGIISGIAAMFVFAAGISFFLSFLPSFINFISFAFQRAKYYNKLKQLIIHSNDYGDFVNEMNTWIEKILRQDFK